VRERERSKSEEDSVNRTIYDLSPILIITL